MKGVVTSREEKNNEQIDCNRKYSIQAFMT